MPSTKKLLQAAAGNAGGDKLYVEDVFSTYLYTGSSSNQTITNGIDLDGEGGLVWIKNRTNTTGHFLSDTNRGVVGYLRTESNGASVGASNVLTSYNSNGFGISTNSGVNASPQNYCSWTFRKAPGFFDIVTYTGDAVVGREIAHNLETTPSMIIVKSTGAQGNWYVWHKEANSGDGYLLLNTTAAINTGGKYVWGNDVNYIAPTDTKFTVAGGTAVNGSGTEYVAYIFGDDASFGAGGDESIVKCGSFTTSAGAVGTVTGLGWEPQWVLTKESSDVRDWYLNDSMRGMPVGSAGSYLEPNTSDIETTGNPTIAPNADGFVQTGNGGNATYIYIAIRRPMKVPESGTEVYNNLANRIGTSAAATISGVGFAVDLMIPFAENTGSSKPFVDRLRGATKYLLPPYTNAEQTTTDAVTSFASNDGVLVGADASLQVINNYYNASRRYAASFFKRAAGFMDVVCYTGTGATGNAIAHNLTVAPELAIFKGRSGLLGTNDWQVIANFTAANYIKMVLNTANAALGPYTYAINAGIAAVPTAETITVDNVANFNNGSSNYVLYLFATLAGVSKVGSYTGTGADLNVDCGFTAGARFILIKRTDSTGDWYMWDSARGINAGNSPYLIINTTGASVTNTDYIDPLNAGFTVTSTAPTAINASGGSYIFLAIA